MEQEKELHITSCLHPLRVRNKFTNEMVTVPCGKCEACTTRQSFKMIQRLKMERCSWKYCLFVTLTYDNDHLPLLTFQTDYLTDLSASRVHPIKGVMNFQVSEELKKIHRANTVDIQSTKNFIELMTSHFGGLPYLSSVDIQRFIKRLRITLLRKYNRYELKEKDSPSFRYFCCGEYGPSTFRPHYHLLLFFSSGFIASHISEYIRECWQFGYTDSSFVSDCNASYVAGYVNGTAHLPAIYQTAKIRPFSLYSKHPALGSLVYSSEVLKSQFLSCDVSQSFLYTTEKLPLNVPLWRTFQDSLYPKLPYFSELSPAHRNKLYRICEKQSFAQSDRSFQRFCNLVNSSTSDYIKSYIDKMVSVDGDLIQKYYRWYYVSLRVLTQSEIFDIYPKDYVECIEKFYNNKDYALLKRQFQFEQDYSSKHDVCQLIGLDKQFIDSLSSAIIQGFAFEDLDACEQLYLKSFNKLDLDILFSSDLDARRTYLYQLDFEFSDEYLLFKDEKIKIYEKSTKTKKKNDYLNSQVDDFYQELACF